jgi:Arc/MetJ-type ribon-helix-helix transcriptional regulator
VGSTKRKAVINAESSHLERVQQLVEEGRYETVSEFMREAVAEKLERIERDRVAEAVERYCSAGHADEDADLMAAQAYDAASRRLSGKSRRRASR